MLRYRDRNAAVIVRQVRTAKQRPACVLPALPGATRTPRRPHAGRAKPEPMLSEDSRFASRVLQVLLAQHKPAHAQLVRMARSQILAMSRAGL